MTFKAFYPPLQFWFKQAFESEVVKFSPGAKRERQVTFEAILMTQGDSGDKLG